jgi:hypothetical protein
MAPWGVRASLVVQLELTTDGLPRWMTSAGLIDSTQNARAM